MHDGIPGNTITYHTAVHTTRSTISYVSDWKPCSVQRFRLLTLVSGAQFLEKPALDLDFESRSKLKLDWDVGLEKGFCRSLARLLVIVMLRKMKMKAASQAREGKDFGLARRRAAAGVSF